MDRRNRDRRTTKRAGHPDRTRPVKPEQVTDAHIRAVFTAVDKILRAGRTAATEVEDQDVDEAIAS